MRTLPDPTRMDGVCMACEHWQISVASELVRELGRRGAFWAMAEAHNEHIWGDCPGGTEGRVKFEGQWVERPILSSGKTPDGLLAMHPRPTLWRVMQPTD